MAGNFRNGAYDALVEALRTRREALGLSQMAVAAAMPNWLGFDHTMLNKIEHKVRDVSFIEVRELAKILQTTIAELDATATELEDGRSHPVTTARGKRAHKKR